VNGNTSREKGSFADFLFAAFLRQAFVVSVPFPLSSLLNVPVSSTMSLYPAGGKRKEKKYGNCSKPGHTIEYTYTANLSGWLDSQNDLSFATSKKGINNDIPLILRMNEHNHGSNRGPEHQRGAYEGVLSQNQSHKLISPLHMASVIPSFSTKCCQRGPPLSFRRR
jgi:hypothetical protein